VFASAGPPAQQGDCAPCAPRADAPQGQDWPLGQGRHPRSRKMMGAVAWPRNPWQAAQIDRFAVLHGLAGLGSRDWSRAQLGSTGTPAPVADTSRCGRHNCTVTRGHFQRRGLPWSRRICCTEAACTCETEWRVATTCGRSSAKRLVWGGQGPSNVPGCAAFLGGIAGAGHGLWGSVSW